MVFRIPLKINGERAVLNGSIVALSEAVYEQNCACHGKSLEGNLTGKNVTMMYYIDGTTEGLQFWFCKSTFGDLERTCISNLYCCSEKHDRAKWKFIRALRLVAVFNNETEGGI